MARFKNASLGLVTAMGLSLGAPTALLVPASAAYASVTQSTQLVPAAPEEKKPVRNTAQWNLPKKTKLAIGGYDPVGYFPEGGSKAVKGKKRITYNYLGAEYRFSSAKNRDTFKANPARYEAAHGGWCSWAMKTGNKTKPDPRNFIVKDDRLFLFYKGFGGDTKKSWVKQKDHSGQARTADREWKQVSGESKRQVKVPPAEGK